MTVPYFARMVCLCFAAFFWLHFALAAIAAAVAGRAVRRATRMRPQAGARFLFALRLAPAALAGTIAAGVCAPSYLWFEPEPALEHIGLFCIASAIAGMVVCAAGIARGVCAAARSARRRATYAAASASDAPVLLLAGVFRSRLVVSRGILEALTREQLAVALRHERAHGEARDNLKRLVILLAPDTLPFVRGLSAIERGWARLAEWSADDRAVRGSRRRSLALASALVRVARMGTAPHTPALATHLLGDLADLAARVDRLLEEPSSPFVKTRLWPVAAVSVFGAAAALNPPALELVHELLEALAH